MKRSDIEWFYLRRHTLRPAISVVLAVAVLAAALWLHAGKKQLFDELNATQSAVHEDYAALVRQRRLVDRYHRRYQLFHELGFIGRESRLDWVETLRTTTAGLDLPRVVYSIEPQLRVLAPVTSILGGESISIHVSTMQLQLGLFHELDLLRFFDVLQNKAPGLINVDQCELAYVGEDNSGATDINLTATCTVQIYSVITSDVGEDTA